MTLLHLAAWRGPRHQEGGETHMRGASILRLAAVALACFSVLALVAAIGKPSGLATAQETKPELPGDLARIQPASFLIGSANVSGILNSEGVKGIKEKALQS